MLSTGVESVTMAGLAEIVGASSCGRKRLSAGCRLGRFSPRRGTAWCSPAREPVGIVLPKLAGGVMETLKTAAELVNVELALLETTAIIGVPSVVELDMRPATRVEGLFTPQVMTSLDLVNATPRCGWHLIPPSICALPEVWDRRRDPLPDNP